MKMSIAQEAMMEYGSASSANVAKEREEYKNDAMEKMPTNMPIPSVVSMQMPMQATQNGKEFGSFNKPKMVI
jgi:hypothetical protein